MKNNIEKLLSEIGQIKLESEDQNKALSKVLRRMLDVFNCDRAWCLSPCDPESEDWGVPIEVTRYEWPGAFEVDLRFPMTEADTVIFNSFINAKGAVTYGKDADFPMLEEHEKAFKVKSQIATVIYPKHGAKWLFGIHFCATHHSFSDDERESFDLLGKKIGQVFDNLIF